jgi:hypothetical protein
VKELIQVAGNIQLHRPSVYPIDVDIPPATFWSRQRRDSSLGIPGKAVLMQMFDSSSLSAAPPLRVADNPKESASVARVGEVRVGRRVAALLEEFWALNNRLNAMAQPTGTTATAK